MQKRIAHILIATLFFIGTTGMTLSNHYCDILISSVNVSLDEDNCCDTPVNCCKHETIAIPIEDAFTIATNTFDFNTLAIFLPSTTELIQNNEAIETITSRTEYWGGPPPKIQTILSRFQSYLL